MFTFLALFTHKYYYKKCIKKQPLMGYLILRKHLYGFLISFSVSFMQPILSSNAPQGHLLFLEQKEFHVSTLNSLSQKGILPLYGLFFKKKSILD